MNFMKKWRENAGRALEEQISALERRTVSPDRCAAHDDKVKMHRQEMEIEALRSNLEDVRKGNVWGCFIAFRLG